MSVGKNIVFGEDVKPLTGMHMNIADSRRLGVELHHVPEPGGGIIIEDGVYIGSGAFSMVATSAVVAKNVAPMTMAASVPDRMPRNFG